MLNSPKVDQRVTSSRSRLRLVYLFLLSLPLAAQSLSLSCPPPAKFNQPAVCALNFTGSASSLQWKLSSTPGVTLAVASAIPGKTISTANGIYLLMGMNSTNLSGKVATVTVPAKSGTVTVTLLGTLGSSSSGHAVQVNPATSVTVQ